MKKIYLILVLLSLPTYAQFFEGFEGGTFPPTGWITSNAGLGTLPWKQNAPNWLAYEGSSCAYIDRQLTLMGYSEYWLVSPGIVVTNQVPLTFFSRQSLTGDDATAVYQVRISTTSQTDQSSFTMLRS